jgi:hypothetical protein
MYDGEELAVLPPELLPNSLESLASYVEQGRVAASEALGPLLDSDRWDPVELAPLALRAHERLRALCGGAVRIESDPNETPMNRANDKALYIFRASAAPALLLASSAAQAYLQFLDELVTAGTELSSAELGRIHLQFIVIFKLLSGRTAGYELEQEVLLPVPALPPRSLDPLRRWVRGHHAFMVILQWQVILFQCLRRHVDNRGAGAQACELLKLLILAMRSTLQAFRFTGEFNSDAYARLVRPTLMPPTAPAGMSGLNWRDHQYLLKNLKKLDGGFVGADVTMHTLYGVFKEELRTVYDAHKHVCARFVGNEAISLLSTTSAVTIIDRLKDLRSRLL